MPSVSPWSPTYDFEGDEDPQNLINAAALQAQLNLIAEYLADQGVALGEVIGDDDTLRDDIVRLRNLHPELADYIESGIEGSVATQALDFWFPVRLASTANLATLVGQQTIDGVLTASGDRVLLKNQTDASQNGLWVVHHVGDAAPHAAGLWVRADDLEVGDSSGSGWAVCVEEGTLNGETAWMILAGESEAGTEPVVGTDDLEFMSVLGTFPVPISRGGTGAVTATAARTAIGAAGKATGTITGTGAATAFVIAHSLATADVVVSVRANATNEQVGCQIVATAANVTVTFATAPALAVVYTVTIVG